MRAKRRFNVDRERERESERERETEREILLFLLKTNEFYVFVQKIKTRLLSRALWRQSRASIHNLCKSFVIFFTFVCSFDRLIFVVIEI